MIRELTLENLRTSDHRESAYHNLIKISDLMNPAETFKSKGKRESESDMQIEDEFPDEIIA